jgi:hypothetical protein
MEASLESIDNTIKPCVFESHSRSWTAVSVLFVGLIFTSISLPRFGILDSGSIFGAFFLACNIAIVLISLAALILNIKSTIQIDGAYITVQNGRKFTRIKLRDITMFTCDFSERVYEITYTKNGQKAIALLPRGLINKKFVQCFKELAPWVSIVNG